MSDWTLPDGTAYHPQWLDLFVRESYSIEGYKHTDYDWAEHHQYLFDFLAADDLTVESVSAYVRQTTTIGTVSGQLRDKPGMNVSVGDHDAPPGGTAIGYALEQMLAEFRSGYDSISVCYQRYLHLHPFTDGNGRSARAIWLWLKLARTPVGATAELPVEGFLRTYHYDTLADYDAQQAALQLPPLRSRGNA